MCELGREIGLTRLKDQKAYRIVRVRGNRFQSLFSHPTKTGYGFTFFRPGVTHTARRGGSTRVSFVIDLESSTGFWAFRTLKEARWQAKGEGFYSPKYKIVRVTLNGPAVIMEKGWRAYKIRIEETKCTSQ